jgi:phage tail protein X
VPPFNATGGDLVDQVRDWIERQRERVNGRANGTGPRPAARKPGRRTGGRLQAVPLGSPQARAATLARPGARTGRPLRRADRAERNTYTLILAAVLLILVIALFFALNWVLGGSSTPAPSATPGPSPAPTLQPPSSGASPPPAIVPSPSPTPEIGAQPPGSPPGRIHVVEGGDTLNRIAQRYGVTVDAIMQANGFTERNRILRIGERLVIPDPGAAPAAPGAPVGSPIPR